MITIFDLVQVLLLNKYLGLTSNQLYTDSKIEESRGKRVMLLAIRKMPCAPRSNKRYKRNLCY